jgi:hypothetical protein
MLNRLLFALLLFPTLAFALDKQGSAHGGVVSTARDFNVAGTVMLGFAPWNTS